MTEKFSADEMFESLTGFEEIAIATHFGAEITDLAEKRPLAFVRALVFVDKVRDGSSPLDAKAQAMGLSIKGTSDYFPEAEQDVDETEPDTESGKDDSLVE